VGGWPPTKCTWGGCTTARGPCHGPQGVVTPRQPPMAMEWPCHPRAFCEKKKKVFLNKPFISLRNSYSSYFRGTTILVCKGLMIFTKITIPTNRSLPNRKLTILLQGSISQTKWALKCKCQHFD